MAGPLLGCPHPRQSPVGVLITQQGMQRRAGCVPQWSLGGQGPCGREAGEGAQGQAWRAPIPNQVTSGEKRL